MDPHTSVEIKEAVKKVQKPVCRVCRMIRIYLLFVVPILVLLWSGIDVGLNDIDSQDLVVNIVLGVLAFQIIRRIYIDYFKRD
ncbi:MAG: hypothetical protein CBC42_05430 [Betaproteobacteria bacterium TMED82]|nr:MAG: hypothetical protein CBC42_05430 [Betaproteobacteria bacterium TMED82]|tara:strand:- start:143691 stop:143939 length:249 start_codon:yes stop_codon:yes gene_type:complete